MPCISQPKYTIESSDPVRCPKAFSSNSLLTKSNPSTRTVPGRTKARVCVGRHRMSIGQATNHGPGARTVLTGPQRRAGHLAETAARLRAGWLVGVRDAGPMPGLRARDPTGRNHQAARFAGRNAEPPEALRVHCAIPPGRPLNLQPKKRVWHTPCDKMGKRNPHHQP